jgi:hypothetical protein
LAKGNTGMVRTILLRAVGGALVAAWMAGCATDRLDAAPPGGVNLSGDWVLNVNLSDDPDKLGPDPDITAPKPSGGHRGHGGGRGGPGGGGGMGMPPIGGEPPTGDNYQGYGFVKVGLDQSGSTPPASGKPSRGASINRFLRAPATLSITQDKGTLTVKTNMPDGTQTADVYTAGEKRTIPFGQDNTAERTSGWRGPVFVVTTSAKKFGNREDDFAIDADDGRLIMTTLTSGGKLGKVAITRVYDRAKQP